MLDLASLNPQQRLAVETVDGPVLILAGAGTGKTRVITCRIAHLIRQGVSPRNILAVTFTNKAAREMQERLAGLTGARDRSDRPLISTFHSLCVRILRRHIARLGYKENFVIYSESDQVACLKKILSRISARGEAVDADAVLRLISRWKNAGGSGMAGADPAVAALADHVRSGYDSALRACNAVDFDDLILLVLKLFAEIPEVLAECRERFRFVMVDEYQDTNAAQFRLIQYLAGEHRNLCVVGDDDQSIYGWRGAEAANLLDLERHFPGIKIIKLEQNYRSNATILNAANALIKNNPRRRGKQLWSKNGQGGNILLHVFKDDEEEARVIVEEIQYARVARRIPWADQAILFRTNQQSRSLETALRQAEVRYHLIGGQSYFDRKEVKDFLAYLKAIVNPDDDVSLLRIANVPARGLSDVTMERLIAASHERQCSVHAVMRHTDIQESFIRRTREQLVSFLELLARARADLGSGADVSLRSWADRFFTGIGYFEELRRGERDPTAGENRIRNVKELIATLDEAVPGSGAVGRIQEFLEELTLDSDRSEEEERTGDAVTLITIHSCKGLEFPHVYIVGLEDGLLPHGRSKLEGTLDEERRLFYVAITRAMRGLTLSYCTGRKRFGQLLPCHPSPFLRELPPELIEDAAKQGKAPVSVDAGKSLFASIRSAIGTGE